MYTIINPEELRKLQTKLTAKDFSCSVDSFEFNVKVMDITTNSRLKFNEACKAINYLLGESYNFEQTSYAPSTYPCFNKVAFNNYSIKEGFSSAFITITLNVAHTPYSPLIKVDLPVAST